MHEWCYYRVILMDCSQRKAMIQIEGLQFTDSCTATAKALHSHGQRAFNEVANKFHKLSKLISRKACHVMVFSQQCFSISLSRLMAFPCLLSFVWHRPSCGVCTLGPSKPPLCLLQINFINTHRATSHESSAAENLNLSKEEVVQSAKEEGLPGATEKLTEK